MPSKEGTKGYAPRMGSFEGADIGIWALPARVTTRLHLLLPAFTSALVTVAQPEGQYRVTSVNIDIGNH
jgi:hypothetical protein